LAEILCLPAERTGWVAVTSSPDCSWPRNTRTRTSSGWGGWGSTDLKLLKYWLVALQGREPKALLELLGKKLLGEASRLLLTTEPLPNP
jgi:hypothetical protein